MRRLPVAVCRMKRTPIRKIGKKGKEWQRERQKRVEELKKDPRYKVDGYNVYGVCPDCRHFHPLTPDHLTKRSRGGGHEAGNIDWVCNYPGCWCHYIRDNTGDDMKKPEEKKSKKANWAKPHPCKNCKKSTSLLICSNCGRMSV